MTIKSCTYIKVQQRIGSVRNMNVTYEIHVHETVTMHEITSSSTSLAKPSSNMYACPVDRQKHLSQNQVEEEELELVQLPNTSAN